NRLTAIEVSLASYHEHRACAYAERAAVCEFHRRESVVLFQAQQSRAIHETTHFPRQRSFPTIASSPWRALLLPSGGQDSDPQRPGTNHEEFRGGRPAE